MDPRLDSHGGIMHAGIDVGEPWETAGESWAYLGPVGGRSAQGVGHTLAEAVLAHLWMTRSLWAPYVGFGVHV